MSYDPDADLSDDEHSIGPRTEAAIVQKMVNVAQRNMPHSIALPSAEKPSVSLKSDIVNAMELEKSIVVTNSRQPPHDGDDDQEEEKKTHRPPARSPNSRSKTPESKRKIDPPDDGDDDDDVGARSVVNIPIDNGKNVSEVMFEKVCKLSSEDQLAVIRWRPLIGADFIPGLTKTYRIGAGTSGHSIAALTLSGKCYMWGKGAISLEGIMAQSSIPYLLDTKPFGGIKLSNVYCGGGHTFAVTEEKELFGWGDAQLSGHVDLHQKGREWIKSPHRVSCFTGRQVSTCGAGVYHSIVSTYDKAVFTWGKTGPWLGRGRPTEEDAWIPTPLDSFSELVTSIACGPKHSVLLTHSGTLYAFGSGKNGRLGLGDDKDRTRPNQVTQLKQHKIVSIACGGRHSAAVAASGNLFTWGDNSRAQLGVTNAPKGGAKLPLQIPFANKAHIVSVACGFNQTFSLSRSGHVFMTGTANAECPTVWTPKIMVALSTRVVYDITSTRDTLIALATQKEREAASEQDADDVPTQLSVKVVHDASESVLAELNLDLYSAESLILIQVRKSIWDLLKNVVESDFFFMSEGILVQEEDEDTTAVLEILESFNDIMFFKIKATLKKDYVPKYSSFLHDSKREKKAAVDSKKVRVNISLEKPERAIGYMIVQAATSLLEFRTLMAEELDEVPSDFQFLSEGIPVGRKQEEKRIISDFVPNLVVRVSSAKQATTLNPDETLEEKSTSSLTEVIIRCEGVEKAIGTLDLEDPEEVTLQEVRDQMKDELEGFLPDKFVFLKQDTDGLIPISVKQEAKKKLGRIKNDKNEIFIRSENAQFRYALQAASGDPVPAPPPPPAAPAPPPIPGLLKPQSYRERVEGKGNLPGVTNASKPIALPIMTALELDKLRAGLKKVQ